jgi:hypothetical protein
MFVYIATTSSEVTCHLKSKLVPEISSLMQVVPLTTFTNNVLYYHLSMHRLNFDGTQ